MKAIILNTLAIFALFIGQVQAQHPHHKPHHHHNLEKMSEDLDLSEAQVQELKQMFESEKQKHEEMREEGKRNHHEMRKQHEANMKEILTAEQFEKFQQMHEARREKMHKHRNSPEMKQARKEVQAYMHENVFPVVKSQRQKFEKELSKADRKKIADLREQRDALHAEFKAKHKARKEGEHKRPTEAEREKMHKRHEEMRAIMEEAKKIAEKYDEPLKALREEIADQEKQWEEDMRSIMEKHKPTDAPDMKEGELPPPPPPAMHAPDAPHPPHPPRHPHHEGRRGKHHKGMHKHMKAVHFLLMDPNADAPQDDFMGEIEEQGFEMNVYPNPASSQTTLTYEVKNPGKVRIELIDKDGNVMRTIQEVEQKAGSYEIMVDVSGLDQSVYYFLITDAKGKESKKVVKW